MRYLLLVLLLAACGVTDPEPDCTEVTLYNQLADTAIVSVSLTVCGPVDR